MKGRAYYRSVWQSTVNFNGDLPGPVSHRHSSHPAQYLGAWIRVSVDAPMHEQEGLACRQSPPASFLDGIAQVSQVGEQCQH